jgi:hypothetical protein
MQLMESLLKARADGNSTDSDGQSALHIAVEVGNLRMVERLLQAQPNVDAVDYMDGTTLQAAAAGCHLEALNLILAAHVEMRLGLNDLMINTGLSTALYMHILPLRGHVSSTEENILDIRGDVSDSSSRAFDDFPQR